MFIGTVQCEVELSKTHRAFEGLRFLLVEPEHEVEWEGAVVAVDTVKASVGDMVIVALAPLGSQFDVPEDLPIDGAVVGIVSSITTPAEDGEAEEEIESGRGRGAESGRGRAPEAPRGGRDRERGGPPAPAPAPARAFPPARPEERGGRVEGEGRPGPGPREDRPARPHSAGPRDDDRGAGPRRQDEPRRDRGGEFGGDRRGGPEGRPPAHDARGDRDNRSSRDRDDRRPRDVDSPVPPRAGAMEAEAPPAVFWDEEGRESKAPARAADRGRPPREEPRPAAPAETPGLDIVWDTPDSAPDGGDEPGGSVKRRTSKRRRR